LNYRSAFEFVSDCLEMGDPITEGMVRKIHRKLVIVRVLVPASIACLCTNSVNLSLTN
jgi:hypothetical protein